MKNILSERQLLSKKELAARWGVAEGTIDIKVKEGIITPVKGLPSPIRFNIEDVLEVEGSDQGKLSFTERRKLERENKDLKERLTTLENENTELKEYVKSIIGTGVRFINVS